MRWVGPIKLLAIYAECVLQDLWIALASQRWHAAKYMYINIKQHKSTKNIHISTYYTEQANKGKISSNLMLNSGSTAACI